MHGLISKALALKSLNLSLIPQNPSKRARWLSSMGKPIYLNWQDSCSLANSVSKNKIESK